MTHGPGPGSRGHTGTAQDINVARSFRGLKGDIPGQIADLVILRDVPAQHDLSDLLGAQFTRSGDDVVRERHAKASVTMVGQVRLPDKASPIGVEICVDVLLDADICRIQHIGPKDRWIVIAVEQKGPRASGLGRPKNAPGKICGLGCRCREHQFEPNRRPARKPFCRQGLCLGKVHECEDDARARGDGHGMTNERCELLLAGIRAIVADDQNSAKGLSRRPRHGGGQQAPSLALERDLPDLAEAATGRCGVSGACQFRSLFQSWSSQIPSVSMGGFANLRGDLSSLGGGSAADPHVRLVLAASP